MKTFYENLQKFSPILLMVVVILLLINLFYKPKPDLAEMKEYWEKAGFKTDSVKAYIDYEKLKLPEFKNYVPPAIVIRYIDSTRRIDNSRTVTLDSGMLKVIDSLKGIITNINPVYLKVSPTAPKILYGEFSWDSLKLDLIDIKGEITRNKLHVDYNRFKYQFRDGYFFADPIPKTKPNNWSSALYLQAGYEWTTADPIIGADYSIYYKRLRGRAGTWVTVDKQPTISVQTTLGYRLR